MDSSRSTNAADCRKGITPGTDIFQLLDAVDAFDV